jgi:hypothetical protein
VTPPPPQSCRQTLVPSLSLFLIAHWIGVSRCSCLLIGSASVCVILVAVSAISSVSMSLSRRVLVCSQHRLSEFHPCCFFSPVSMSLSLVVCLFGWRLSQCHPCCCSCTQRCFDVCLFLCLRLSPAASSGTLWTMSRGDK